jgi:hypothetical protein
MRFVFNGLIQGFGVQIQAAFYGRFTAELEAFDASNASLGSVTLTALSLPFTVEVPTFIGVLSSAVDIQSVVVKAPVAVSSPQDFLINGPCIQTGGAVVPEPALYGARGRGVVGVGLPGAEVGQTHGHVVICAC